MCPFCQLKTPTGLPQAGTYLVPEKFCPQVGEVKHLMTEQQRTVGGYNLCQGMWHRLRVPEVQPLYAGWEEAGLGSLIFLGNPSPAKCPHPEGTAWICPATGLSWPECMLSSVFKYLKHNHCGPYPVDNSMELCTLWPWYPSLEHTLHRWHKGLCPPAW